MHHNHTLKIKVNENKTNIITSRAEVPSEKNHLITTGVYKKAHTHTTVHSDYTTTHFKCYTAPTEEEAPPPDRSIHPWDPSSCNKLKQSK